MQVISTIESGQEAVDVLRVTQDLVEVDDGVEVAPCSDPGVDRLSVGFVQRTWVVVVRSPIGRYGPPKYLQPMRVSPQNHLLICGEYALHQRGVLRWSDFALARKTSKIIHTFEQDDPAHALRREHIAIESRQRIRTQSIA